MKERVVRFGGEGNLVGVLCEPDAPSEKPWVLLSNVGLNHHVGPRRVWVDLARRLAGLGVGSLRFDCSGLGDSDPRQEALGDRARVTRDAREALDFVAARGPAKTAYVVGLCSGTDAAYDLARDDARVVGAFFIDGYAYRARGFAFYHIWKRIAQPRRWRLFLARRLGGGELGGGEAMGGVFQREYPRREDFAQTLQAMLAERKRLGFVYTNGAEASLNHPAQFWAFAGVRDGVDLWYRQSADHLFTRLQERQWLLDTLQRWILSG